MEEVELMREFKVYTDLKTGSELFQLPFTELSRVMINSVELLHNQSKSVVTLELEDKKELKPKTRTEHVKVEFKHAWEAVKAFEEGEELFITQAAGGYSLINDAASVLHCREYASVYRKVEKEIDTREENGKAIYRLMCELEDKHEIDGYHNSWGELRDEWKEIYKELAIQVGYVAPE